MRNGDQAVQRHPVIMLGVFGVTLFVSATLLFLVQPMIGKMITPLLGGTPAVWNTCMVFFQGVLLAGYAYAHGTTAWLGVRRQALLHLGILVLPFLFFPLSVNAELMRGSEENPIPPLLLLLFVTVGVPFFVVSTSAPLLQKWFASTTHPAARDPYFLYGSSNLGSLLALVGYPFVYEYFVPLSGQRTLWVFGYAVLVLLVATCAVFLWLSPRVPTPVKSPPGPGDKQPDPVQAAAKPAQGESRQKAKGRRKTGSRDTVSDPSATSQPIATASAFSQKVTWARRGRWVLLAAVPSSLMLGVTTFMTTDIAAISWLWLPPLTLYLLSFIIVFARVPPLFHVVMVIIMPLLILTAVFLGGILGLNFNVLPMHMRILLHLAVLFVVALVCHGELARDRPNAQSLTEFFLWMSFGGVLGGVFNALLAPVLFVGNFEYPLALVVACMLLPSLGWDLNMGSWGVYADMGLGSVFATIGMALIGLRWWDDGRLPLTWVARESKGWFLLPCLLAVGLVLVQGYRARERRLACCFDLVLPFALCILVAGFMWGIASDTIEPSFVRLARKMEVEPSTLRYIVTFGVPAILCYTFVERSTRLGLGVAAILLASCVCRMDDETLLFQTRSFFGVLRVEVDGPCFRLVHGNTLHGQQFRADFNDSEYDVDEPIAYYSHSGPVGHLFNAYSPDAHNLSAVGGSAGPGATLTPRPGIRPNLGVIGLGTGTMAAYAEGGQHITFYDIDPAVRDISFTDHGWFTFVANARQRGVYVADLVLGDARLTLQRQQFTEDNKYGILIVDAFSSDAIPIHLINQDALRIYLDKLNDNGIIAFHISNRYLNLLPVLANLAEAEDLVGLYEKDKRDDEIWKTSTTWVVLARKSDDLERLPNEVSRDKQVGVRDWAEVRSVLRSACVLAAELPDPRWKDLRKERDPRVGVWTDDYSNLFSVFYWGGQ
jgi:hypothetical protein